MNRTVFRGAGVALVTPMHPDGGIHYEMLGRLIDLQLAGHTDAIVVAGTSGEGSTLTDEEHRALVSYTVRRVNHRVPVIAGAGSNNTAHAVALSKAAALAGADALLHVTPYYNKASQRGLIRHFDACANATDLPVILYNIPARTGVNIQPETYSALCENERIVGVKEASGNFSQMAEIAALCGDRLDLYSGNDDQIASALALGAKGVISVWSNLMPCAVHDLCQHFFDGDSERSHTLQLQYLALIEALFCDVNPIPVKQALIYMGLDVGPCRLPLCEMEPALAEKLRLVLEKYHLCADHLDSHRTAATRSQTLCRRACGL
ncbi:4-hydroxy-tetrahydrodipicolinate synthase [Clostridium sp. D33t1_170424_F3]|uniref:4-hydroxy-tetrahydrodipicolinate synthase n=1 Tax=Clostridium sp. D33t1_170424_F3 TaxID=2787099 RepID=UPI0018A8ED17|nr:4-hydroxy-tetrahydrodipicolinate synthase [Clostridium sp. D33t1_170424_F3]